MSSSTFINLHSGLPLCLLPAPSLLCKCPAHVILPIQEETPAFIPRVFSTYLHLCGGSPAGSLLSVQIPTIAVMETSVWPHLSTSVPCKRGRAHSPDIISPPPWTCLTWPQVPCYPHGQPHAPSRAFSRSFWPSLYFFINTVALLCCSPIVPGFKNLSLHVHGMADQLHPPKTFHFLCLYLDCVCRIKHDLVCRHAHTNM